MDIRKLVSRSIRNWPAKVISIAASIFLYASHTMLTRESRFFSVPLVVETSEELIPASSYPRMVRVTLRGDATAIYPIVEDDIEIFANFTKYLEQGSYKAPVEWRKKGTAQGIRGLEITVDPLEVNLDLDFKKSKTVSLAPNIQGFVENWYELMNYTLDPSQVTIEGPVKLL